MMASGRGTALADPAVDDLPDPYGGPMAGYEACWETLDPVVREIARVLR